MLTYYAFLAVLFAVVTAEPRIQSPVSQLTVVQPVPGMPCPVLLRPRFLRGGFQWQVTSVGVDFGLDGFNTQKPKEYGFNFDGRFAPDQKGGQLFGEIGPKVITPDCLYIGQTTPPPNKRPAKVVFNTVPEAKKEFSEIFQSPTVIIVDEAAKAQETPEVFEDYDSRPVGTFDNIPFLRDAVDAIPAENEALQVNSLDSDRFQIDENDIVGGDVVVVDRSGNNIDVSRPDDATVVDATRPKTDSTCGDRSVTCALRVLKEPDACERYQIFMSRYCAGTCGGCNQKEAPVELEPKSCYNRAGTVECVRFLLRNKDACKYYKAKMKRSCKHLCGFC